MTTKRVLLGNEAIARGLLEGGCQVMASYPGTPATEILPALVRFREEEGAQIYIEWSTNEKVAFEVALAAAYAGKRAAVAMKQVGLNVASDPLFSSLYTGVKGGFLIIAADDPGPHSSQTEQDSRLWGPMAKVPVLDPSSPQEAKEMVPYAFALSERYEIPVLLRPTLRICHARQTITFGPVKGPKRKARFEKDPRRWAATPRWRYRLHQELNRKLEAIRREYVNAPFNGAFIGGRPFDPSRGPFPLGVIAAGSCFGTMKELLEELELEVPLFKVATPFPFPFELLLDFLRSCDQILILEEPDAALELLIPEKGRVRGRLDGTVPSAGELTPEVIEEVFLQVWEGKRPPRKEPLSLTSYTERPPTLCPGCPHRASFYAIKRAFPQAIFTSDIGCYTLGLNQGAVDIVLDMGAAINMAAGLWEAFVQDGEEVPIVASIGDSTFFHAGLPALLNAVHTGARFVLVILDNGTTAMTGMQPTPAVDQLADGRPGEPIPLERALKGCGVDHIEVVDPYDVPRMIGAVREAYRSCHSRGKVAVVIARHPCVQLTKGVEQRRRVEVHPLRAPLERTALLPVYEKKTPPCNKACPAGNDVEGFLALVAEGKTEEASRSLLLTNPFPAVCGRVCFHPCESSCNRGQFDEPISISQVERFLGDKAIGYVPEKGEVNGRRVAVVGAGPSGLSCAYHLALLGYQVEVFEAMPEPGGLLRYGIPPYRLPKEVLRQEIERIKSLGVRIRTGVRVGRDMPFEELRGYDAVFLAPGAQRPRPLGIPGEDLPGIYRGINFLRALNEGDPPEVRGKVAVIGGGNTAIDVARSLLRLGANPLLLYRRRREDMPAHPGEVEEALAEGVKMEFLLSPVEFIGEGRVREVRLVRMTPGKQDREGRREVQPVEGSEFSIEVDGVIVAVGEEADFSLLPEGFTEEGKVFSGGDFTSSTRSVAHAIGAGREGALAIHRFLSGEEVAGPSVRIEEEVPFEAIELSFFSKGRRPEAPRLSPEEASRGFQEIQGGITEEEAIREARERCFHCGSCTGCDFCLLSCPEGAIRKVDGSYQVDGERCTLCRLCAVACPRSVISMPVAEGCVGCGYCLSEFGCPSLVMNEGKVEIDRMTCVDCGVCVYACHQGAIRG